MWRVLAAAMCEVLLFAGCAGEIDVASEDEASGDDPLLTDSEWAEDGPANEGPLDPAEALVNDESDPDPEDGYWHPTSNMRSCQSMEAAVQDDAYFLSVNPWNRALAFDAAEKLIGPNGVIRINVFWGRTPLQCPPPPVPDGGTSIDGGAPPPASCDDKQVVPGTFNADRQDVIDFVREATGALPDWKGATHHFDVEVTLTGTALRGGRDCYGCAQEDWCDKGCGLGDIPYADRGKRAREFGRFVAATVRELAPLGIHRFSIWNEPNLGERQKQDQNGKIKVTSKRTLFLYSNRHNAAVYVELYREGYTAALNAYLGTCVKGTNGDCNPRTPMILIGELSSGESVGSAERPHYHLAFLERMAKYMKTEYRGQSLYAAGLALHPYQHDQPPDVAPCDSSYRGGIFHLSDVRSDLSVMHRRQKVLSTITRNPDGTIGYGTLPLYLTEFGYFRKPEGCATCFATGAGHQVLPRRRCNEKPSPPCVNPDRAEWTRAAFDFAAEHGARQMLYYTLFGGHGPCDNPNHEWDTGLLRVVGGGPFGATDKTTYSAYCDNGSGDGKVVPKTGLPACAFARLGEWTTSSCIGGKNCWATHCKPTHPASGGACQAALDCMRGVRWEEKAAEACVNNLPPAQQLVNCVFSYCFLMALDMKAPPPSDVFDACAIAAMADPTPMKGCAPLAAACM